MKHVWMLNHYALEPGGTGGTRHFHLAEHLPAYGWRASILAASVELNSGRQRLDLNEKQRIETFAGVPFLWVHTPQYKGNGGGRMLNMLAYTWRVLSPATTRGLDKPDVVIGSSVHPFAAWAGALLARRHQVPFVFEVRDLWPQTLIDLGRLREHSLMAHVMRWLEKWLYRRADRIVTLLPRAVDYIAPLGVDPSKVVWISNGADLAAFPDPGPSSIRSDDVFTLMYFGSHGQANGLDVLLQAMALVRDAASMPCVRLLMIGNGVLKPALRQLARDLDLGDDCVIFRDAVEKRAIPRVATEADAFVITVLDVPGLYRYGISMNKLFDYLAGRRPIIIASAAINNPVEDAQCGLTVPPGDPVALAEAIVEMARASNEQRAAWGDRGRRHVEECYGYDRLAGRLAKVLDDCVAGVSPSRPETVTVTLHETSKHHG